MLEVLALLQLCWHPQSGGGGLELEERLEVELRLVGLLEEEDDDFEEDDVFELLLNTGLRLLEDELLED